MKLYLCIASLAIIVAGCESSSDNKPAIDTPKDTITATTMLADSASGNTTFSAKTDLESFGDIKLGQPVAGLIKTLGEPDNKTKAIEWEADGLMHEDWTWKSKGLIINMASEIGNATTMQVFSIKAKAPCTFKTKANIGIGNSYAEVQGAYKKDINAEESNKEQVTVGSIYGGIIFTFRNDKVEAVFLGAAAE
jgi:hypothetical protein